MQTSIQEYAEKMFYSRTLRVLFVTFAFNLLNTLAPTVSPSTALIINALATSLASYYKLNPSQSY